jgi:hypothetical protein
MPGSASVVAAWIAGADVRSRGLSKVRWTQVGDLMLLQIGPDRLDRIELGRVRRQERDGDASCFLYRSHESNEPLISRTFFALHGRFLYMRFVGK